MHTQSTPSRELFVQGCLTTDVVDEERELRQLLLMRDRLVEFGSGRIALPELVYDLEALLYELESTSEGWREEFINAWGHLEIAYAVALDRQEPVEDASDPALQDDLCQLRDLVDQRLDTYRKPSESPE